LLKRKSNKHKRNYNGKIAASATVPHLGLESLRALRTVSIGGPTLDNCEKSHGAYV
jgi:hypothetical protein